MKLEQANGYEDKNVINHVLLKFNENWKYFKSSLNDKTVLPAALTGVAHSVERYTAGQEVAGSIHGAGPILRVLKLPKKKVFHSVCKRLDICVAQITTHCKTGVPVSGS